MRLIPAWLAQTTSRERSTLIASFAGYGVDGYDVMMYSFIIPSLLSAWHMSKAQAGYVATAALITSAIGGWGAGVMADRYGRVRILQLTILWFALCTFLSGFTHSFWQLLVTRAMQGFGFGGEWAVGSVLIAETIAARNRGKASGLVQSSWAVGWGLAAVGYWAAATLAPAQVAWKLLLWSGILPALLIVYIRRRVPEPQVYLATRALGPVNFTAIFGPKLLKTTLLASLLSTGMLSAFYSVTTWLPTYLKAERGLSVASTSGYLLVLIGGSLIGYWCSAWATDALGRRRCFMLFALCGAVLVLAYTRLPLTAKTTLPLGFMLGFFLSGIFSGMGAYLAELYPNAVRGSGQGFCYSVGRALSAGGPALIGSLSATTSLGILIGATAAVSFSVVLLAAWLLPETQGREFSTQPSSA